MIRLPDWPDALLDYIRLRMTAPVRWGEHDCVAFGLGAINVMTGMMLEAPASWRGPKTALKAVEAHGGMIQAVGAFMDTLGCEEVGRAYAQRGDISLVEAAPGDVFGQAVGVVMQGHHLAPGLKGGLARVGLSKTIRVWAVGRAV